ncbi:hypothetical protein [Candidatus Mycobacterium methanotrophicum]|uniref:Transposase n=1 Tax=Candidatus Mycobacterium methanotrophicum TaxID=2943498 RepID=A0ABY4QRB0_9MYCO|nr:hypothetical protein [Candidatus Mycobacterium methanotrophicum]UQX13587.1 hypothetical protein M5I08_25710 [Candidatus Mycobacterium methanotrophicum]
MQAISDWSKNLRVEVRGDDVAQHAGCVLPRMLADGLGLTARLSAAVSRPEVVHDRGAIKERRLVWAWSHEVDHSFNGRWRSSSGAADVRDSARGQR